MGIDERDDQKKIVALSMDPKRLAEMRRARLRLGVKDESYADVDFIKRELKFAQSLYSETTWPVIDVTRKALVQLQILITVADFIPFTAMLPISRSMWTVRYATGM